MYNNLNCCVPAALSSVQPSWSTLPFCLWTLNVHSSLYPCFLGGQDRPLSLLKQHILAVFCCGRRSRDSCLQGEVKQDSMQHRMQPLRDMAAWQTPQLQWK